MSLMLPNGSTIHVKSVQEIEAIERKIAAREPIVLGYMEDGVRKERTIWHPDDPVLFPPGRPRYWVPPKKPGLLQRVRDWLRWHRFP